jgi:fumarate hydratase class I
VAKKIQLPVDEKTIRELHAGDELLVSGTMVTARDAAHKVMVEQRPEWLRPILGGSCIYHCGPIVKQHEDGSWSFVAAGPTTSIREEPYEAAVIGEYQVRGIIGKGGMGAKTLAALGKHGAVYLHAIGGVAPMLAACVKRVKDVHMLAELGVPEAFWEIEVEDFPVVVTMDSHGKSLHDEVETRSKVVLQKYVAL